LTGGHAKERRQKKPDLAVPLQRFLDAEML